MQAPHNLHISQMGQAYTKIYTIKVASYSIILAFQIIEDNIVEAMQKH